MAGANSRAAPGARTPAAAGAASPRARPSPAAAQAAASRIDHAARLLLSHMQFLEGLSHEDHAALCAQPEPHGPLFAWLEGQLHEHGPQPWAVLREALRGHDCEPLAERVMTGSHAQTEGDEAELHAELRGLLDRMLIEEFKRQQQELVPRVTRDPAALAQYQALEQRLKGLLGISPRPT